MSIIKNKIAGLPLLGKYISEEQRKRHLITISIVFIFVVIVQTISFLHFKNSYIYCLSFIQIALSGILFGAYAPIITGLLSNYFLSVVIESTGYYNLNPPFQIITVLMILAGMGIGFVSDIVRKAGIKRIDLSEEEQRKLFSEKVPLWGKYLSLEKRKQRLLTFWVIFFIYLVIQILLFIKVRRGIIFSLNIIPIAISGWLLGMYAPVFTGTLTNFYILLIVRITSFTNEDSIIGILQTIITVLIGCGLGKLSELIDKSRVTEEEIKKSKEEAEHANRAKSEFLACMSHEIRTPINSIMGFARLLKEEVNKPKHIEKIDIILKSGKTLLTLIDDILDLSKIEAGEIKIIKEEFSLRSILLPLNNIFCNKAKERKLEFIISIDTSVPQYLLGDERRIQQIMSNLISNAVKFTEKGSIKIIVNYDEGNLIISVEDTGIGIPGEMQEAIFTVFKRGDPSLTRVYSGTGLGLAITKRLVEKMSGNIKVESTPGTGSLFMVTLPLPEIKRKKYHEVINKSAAYEYTAKTVLSFLDKGLTCKVLVAEDNESNRLYIHELLNRAGIYCDFAKNGRETVDKLEEKFNKGEVYDLLILDIQMPVMSGIEVISYIRNKETLKNIYCIAVTAYALKGDDKKYLDAGCDAYLSKPIEMHELYKHIVTLLEQKGQSMDNESFESPLDKITIGSGHSVKELPAAIDMNILQSLSITEENKLKIKDLIERLKNNYKLYNKQELITIRKESEDILPQSIRTYVVSKIDNSIKTYDDEILLEIIELLVLAVGEGTTQVHS